MNRTLEGRLGKLEQKSGIHDADQLYVMWCRPDENEDELLLSAAREGLVDLDAGKGTWPGGRSICCHWTGANPMPEPRWTTVETMTVDELTFILASVKARWLRTGQMTEAEWDEMDPKVQRLKDPAYIAAQKRNEEMCARFGKRPRTVP